ncbi:MAG: leucyl/phenylalanyl-tRNA--protein transferase [Proteobacteria bacterium]|nr:leucyl/phenylalanyl-tRNA--protein transferase [Pseudomonadota bacterium]
MILLDLSDPFPPVCLARQNAGGLLALGADLSPQRLLDAYRLGIFPWGTHEGLPLWHYPDPRMVLFPGEIRISRSLRKTLRQGRYSVRFDSAFGELVQACAETPRPSQSGTWISPEMQAAYIRLHELGWAHCVETWMEGKLVGGLYGLAIGRVFFGESMFSHRKDASKIAFAHLARFLTTQQFGMIDCQMHTPHLASLGGREIAGNEFSQHLAKLIVGSQTPQHWPVDVCNYDWDIQ